MKNLTFTNNINHEVKLSAVELSVKEARAMDINTSEPVLMISVRDYATTFGISTRAVRNGLRKNGWKLSDKFKIINDELYILRDKLWILNMYAPSGEQHGITLCWIECDLKRRYHWTRREIV